MAFAILDCGRLSIAHFVNFIKLFCEQRQVIILELAETIRFERMDGYEPPIVFKTISLNHSDNLPKYGRNDGTRTRDLGSDSAAI